MDKMGKVPKTDGSIYKIRNLSKKKSVIRYMNLNATKCTFGHSDVTSRKQQKSGKNVS